MTVVSSTNKAVIAGTGAQVAFAFAFNNAWDGTTANLSAALANFTVLFTDAAGNQTTLAQGAGATQCQVALAAPVGSALWGMGGTVTYNPNGTPIAAGTTLTILRALTLAQLVSLQNQASYGQLASSMEQGLDRIEMQTQQEGELFGRAIVVNAADTAMPPPLPPAAQRAGLALVFDAQGNPTVGQAPAAGTISAPMAPVVGAASLAAGRAAFGLGSAAVETIGAYGLADDGAGFLRQSFPISADATNQTVSATFHFTQRLASGPLTYFLARANTLWNGFGFWVTVIAGTAAFSPNAADAFTNNATGTVVTVGPGSYFVSTNGAGAGTWILMQMPPAMSPPGGYLTLTTGRPVVTADVIGSPAIFYTADTGNSAPIWTGGQTVQVPFTSDLVLALSSANLANQAYDVYLCVAFGALTIVAGPGWRNPGQRITGATVSSPIVITANGHSLLTGDTVPVSGVQGNTGANGTWTVTRVDANNFSLNGSVPTGAYTSGGQFAARGFGAGSTQHSRAFDGFLRNANTMVATNGASSFTLAPGAGLYVGSFLVDPAGAQVTINVAWGPQTRRAVWNAFNRKPVIVKAGDNNSGAVTGSPAQWASGAVVTAFSGLAEEPARAFAMAELNGASSTSTSYSVGVGWGNQVAFSGVRGFINNVNPGSGVLTAAPSGEYESPPWLGAINVFGLAQIAVTGATAVGGENFQQVSVQWRG
jgi:hypothetical protein